MLPSWRKPEIGGRVVPNALLQPHRSGYPYPHCPMPDWLAKVDAARKAGYQGKKVGSGYQLVYPRGIKDSVARNAQIPLGPEFDTSNYLPPTRASLQTNSALREMELAALERRIPLSICIATSKARMGQLRTTRSKIERRVRAGLSLMMTHGAYEPGSIGDPSGAGTDCVSEPIAFNVEEARNMGSEWTMRGTHCNLYKRHTVDAVQGWTYIFYPTIEVYRMPYPTLITLLRQCIANLNSKATALEKGWLAKSLLEPPTEDFPLAKAPSPKPKPPPKTSTTQQLIQSKLIYHLPPQPPLDAYEWRASITDGMQKIRERLQAAKSRSAN